MKKVLMIFLLISSFLSAMDRKIRITDDKNIPIHNVVMKVGERLFLTNKNGIGSLTAKSEEDSVFIHKIGYKDEILCWKELPANLSLKIQLLPIAGITVTAEKTTGNPSLKKIIIKNDNRSASVQTAADLLKNHSEIRLLGNDLAGNEKSVSLLGHQAKHTLVLLDGIPLNSSGQKFDISSIPAEIIERLEVIPQNASAISGAGAIGGAINIITKSEVADVDKIITGFNQQFGSFGYIASRVNLAWTQSFFSISANYNKLKSDNDFEYKYFLTSEPEILKRKNSDYEDRNFNLMLTIDVPIKVKYNLIQRSFEKGLPGNIDQILLYDRAELSGDVWRHSMNISYPIKSFLLELKSFYFRENTEFNNLESTSIARHQKGINESGKRGIELHSIFGLKDFSWLLEAEYMREDFSYKYYGGNGVYIPDVSIPNIFQEKNALALTSSWERAFENYQVNLQATGRGDKVLRSTSDIEEFSWQSEGEISWEKGLISKLNFQYGTSYSLPSYYDLYWIGDSQTQGNPDLKPEYSQGCSITAEIVKNWWEFSISYHKNLITNLIYWDRGMNGWKPHNMSDAELTNYQLDFSVSPNIFLDMGGSWLRTIALNKTRVEQGTGFYNKPVIHTPRSETNIFIKLKKSNAYLELCYNRRGRQYESRDGTMPISAFGTYDIEAGYLKNISRFELNITGKINNITDEQYEIYSRMPTPGFNWQAGLGFEYRCKKK